MKIVWIGAGNLATSLAPALNKAGHETLQVYSRTLESAMTLASKLACKATSSIEEIEYNADVYIISVKDSVLSDIFNSLVKGRENALFLHTAGSIPMDIFSSKASHYGVIYPMQTFSKNRSVSFDEIPFFIEANGEKELQKVKLLASSVSRNVTVMDSNKRKYLHLSAVFACNFVNHCYALSAEILESQGIPFSVMFPLIKETEDKVHTISPKSAQTGPAVRYDQNVMNKHLELLSDTPEIANVYETLSKSIFNLSSDKKNN